ncbi:MAG: hypothetical protein AAF985_14370, partial [Bacteroidota bacterium]
MKATLRFLGLLLLCWSMSTAAYSQFVTVTAGSTTTEMPNDGDVFTDPSDGVNGGPGGDCSTTDSGNPGDYPNCNCITTTTLSAPAGQQITVTFTEFRVFGNFDWLAIFDGSGPITATNGSGSATNPTSGDPELWNSSTDGDELVDMTTAGTVTFTSTNGSLTFASRFSGVVNTCGWQATVSLSAPPAPPGDDCAGAVMLPVQSSQCTSQTMGNNTGATASGDATPSCGSFATGEDNWFSLTVPVTGELNITVSDAGGPTDWAMSAYSGSCGALMEIECDDDDGLDLFPNLELTGLIPGNTVYVQVWEVGNNATGAFNICAHDNTLVIVPNDNCAIATPLNVDAAAMCLTQTLGSNVDATASGETPAPSCGAFASGEDLWYSLTVPANGNVNVEMSDAGGPSDWAMSAYSGTCGALSEIECDDDGGPGLFPALNLTGQTPGATIYLRVWEWNNNEEGVFNICAFSPPCDVAITDVASTDETCFEAMDGTITVTATTSNGPLTYNLTGPVNLSNTTGAFTGLPPGTYNVQVVDDGVPPPCEEMAGPITIASDTAPPTLVCPPTAVVSCNDVPSAAGTAAELMAAGGSVMDNCIIASLVAADAVVGDVCPTTAQRVITRTYTATDDSGNSASCNQTITVLNSTTGPVLTLVPPDRTINCAYNAIPEPHLFDADTECGLSVDLTVGDPVYAGTINCPGATIQFTYTATDECGRTATHIQTYTIDNEGPELIVPNEICIIECPEDPAMIINSFNNFAANAIVNTSCISDAFT